MPQLWGGTEDRTVILLKFAIEDGKAISAPEKTRERVTELLRLPAINVAPLPIQKDCPHAHRGVEKASIVLALVYVYKKGGRSPHSAQ